MSQKSFSSLGVSQDTVSILDKKGYEFATPIQEELIPHFFNSDQDLIAQAATGTGKTGAFGIPLIDAMDYAKKEVQAIALAPTRELANQVATELDTYKGKKPIDVIQLCGGQSMKLQIDQLKRIKRATIIVGTPGRIIDHMNKKRLKLRQISHLIIDEVDEMLNFGFKEDMDIIVNQTNQERRTIILSATLPKHVMKTAESYLTNPLILKKTDASKKPNINQKFYKLNRISKIKLLCRVIDEMDDFYGFLFCNTKREVDQIAEQLIQLGYNVESMHGDLSQAQRDRALAKFKVRQCDILVVTDVAARGIDIKNISHVVNLSVPQNTEVYTHRIGRTGRAGQSGTSITFVRESEFHKFKRIMRQQNNAIKKVEIPEAKDVIKKKKRAIVNQISGLEVDDKHLKLAGEILSQSSPEQAIAAMLKSRYSELFNQKNY